MRTQEPPELPPLEPLARLAGRSRGEAQGVVWCGAPPLGGERGERWPEGGGVHCDLPEVLLGRYGRRPEPVGVRPLRRDVSGATVSRGEQPVPSWKRLLLPSRPGKAGRPSRWPSLRWGVGVPGVARWVGGGG